MVRIATVVDGASTAVQEFAKNITSEQLFRMEDNEPPLIQEVKDILRIWNYYLH